MRYLSIDLLRTFAIFVMVYVHFCGNLSGVTPRISGFGAPLFMFLTGLSYHLWLRGQIIKRVPDGTITKVTVRRGLFLFGLGIAFNALVWLPEDTFNWDVLTLIGSATLLFNAVRYWPHWLVLLLCALIAVISPVARQLADWPSYWLEGYYDPGMSASDVVLGYLVTGYFPILPWLVYPLLGLLTGRTLFDTQSRTVPAVAQLNRGLRWGIVSLLVAAIIQVAVGRLSPQPLLVRELRWTMFPASSTYLLGSVGFAMIAFHGLYILLDCGPSESWPRLRNFSGTFSRRSLTAYLLHHLLHLWPLWALGAWAGTETTFFGATPLPYRLRC